LNTALGGSNMVIYFNLNETQKGTDTLSGVDILAWAAITLTDDQGILAPKTFYLTSDPDAAGKAASIASGGPDPSVGTCDVNPVTPYSGNPSCGTLSPNGTPYEANVDPKWTYISGVFCINPDGTRAHFGSCNGDPTEQAGAKSVQNNIGQDQAAFAIWNLTLDDIIAHNGCTDGTFTCANRYDVLQADIRFSMLNNGPEQVFLASTTSTSVLVPEPSSLALLGAALAGLGWTFRRRKQSARRADGLAI